MITKYRYQKLVDKYFEAFKLGLGIKQQVNIHICRSNSKKMLKLIGNNGKNRGLSLINKDSNADVFLYYDLQINEQDAVNTLVHELLHVRVNALSGLVTLKLQKANRVEEKLVNQIANFFMVYFWK